jgi:hypothetical protein
MADNKPSISSDRVTMKVETVHSGTPGETPTEKYTLQVDGQSVHTVKHSTSDGGFSNDHPTPTKDELYREWRHKK